MQHISFKTASFFPKTVRAIGAVFCIFGLGMAWTSPMIGLLFIFIAAVIFTTRYGFEINIGPNFFREFVWVLGWKEGRKTAFKSVEFLFIQRGKFAFLTYALQEKEREAFEGYIKFEGRNEVHALTDVNKSRLVARMKSLGTLLNVDVKDFSDGAPIIVHEGTRNDSNRNQ
jgi:hypothetical protein